MRLRDVVGETLSLQQGGCVRNSTNEIQGRPSSHPQLIMRDNVASSTALHPDQPAIHAAAKSEACPVCNNAHGTSWRAVLQHFRLYQPGMWQFAPVNVAMFGPREGLLVSIGQSVPIFDTLRCWKHRTYRAH